ncbi:MAG: Bax inhibitor-1/YccA family protein [bacterium]|nr:Bax inhibitor-1/YccA family protein [bacterium]
MALRNPVLNESTFSEYEDSSGRRYSMGAAAPNTYGDENYGDTYSESYTSRDQEIERNTTGMTVRSTAIKTIFLLGLVVASAFLSIVACAYSSALLMPIMMGAPLAALIVGIIMCFKPSSSPFFAPLYAILEGAFLGPLSLFFEQASAGIVFQAITATFGVCFLMMALYAFNIIKVNQKFTAFVLCATAGVALTYMLTAIMGAFGIQMPFMHDNGIVGIGINLFVIGVAALNLMVDFENITRGANAHAPKYYEWFCAYGVMVTLIWLYIELLRLLGRRK